MRIFWLARSRWLGLLGFVLIASVQKNAFDCIHFGQIEVGIHWLHHWFSGYNIPFTGFFWHHLVGNHSHAILDIYHLLGNALKPCIWHRWHTWWHLTLAGRISGRGRSISQSLEAHAVTLSFGVLGHLSWQKLQGSHIENWSTKTFEIPWNNWD